MKFPTVEIDKRDRDEHTDTLIKTLLDEEKASKKQKRIDADVGGRPVVEPARKGKTFAEIEAEEGGPVKESLVGMAQTKRALDRKKRDVDVGDTDVITNTERFEKDTLDVEQEDGITFEPFNLKQEREEGYFDDDGNYVLRKQQRGEDGDDEKDAWLASDEAKVVSDAVRRKIEEQRARAEEAARRGPLTERQIAQRKADMAALMRPGETVTRALKRLGGAAGAAAGAAAAGGAAMPHRAMGKRERARLLAQQQQQQQQQTTAAADGASVGAAAAAAADPAAREHFTQLTELADELLAEGEMEIYGATQEELVRSARMWLPQLAAPPAGAAAAAATATAAHTATAAAKNDDEDEDMFADDDDDREDGGAAAAAAAAAQPPPKAGVRAVDEDQDMFADDDDKVEEEQAAGGAWRKEADTAAAGPSGRSDESGQRRAGPDAKGNGTTALAAGGAARASGEEGTRPQPPTPPPTGGPDTVDYNAWPVKELKRLLQERGVDPSGFVEKADLVSKVKEVVDAAPAAGATGGGADGSFVAPAGYVFDPSSGYFYSEDSGMYYDTSTGGYCQASTGKWFYLDPANGSFVEWKQ